MDFYVDTEYPVAKDSLDYITPSGARMDNTVNLRFNRKLLRLFGDRQIAIMDLGCAGGGMVKSFIDMGKVAVGIEGSDFNKRHKAREWPKLPGNLLNADATKPFIVHTGEHVPYQFDVITAWEFWEHILEQDLPGVIDNIHRHLKPFGLLIGTISTKIVLHHVTRKGIEWWIDLFKNNGFDYSVDLYDFIHPDWLRVCEGSFGLVMQKKSEAKNEDTK